MVVLVFIAALFLAYANGANDNFKGVATLFGSGTANYKSAIRWATIMTAFGSVVSVFLAETLIKNFSGKGLVPDEFLHTAPFAISVALGAATTIIIATKFGMPVSTTHGLVGALVGAGFIAAGTSMNFGKLGSSFFLPLIASPLIAAVASLLFYLLFTNIRKKSGITKESCICVMEQTTTSAVSSMETVVLPLKKKTRIVTGDTNSCAEQYAGTIVGLSAQKTLDAAHYISAGAVSFARGLNDTPKMAGLLLLVHALDIKVGAVLLAFVIAIGGLLNAKKVGETMSKKITTMNHGQGFTANLVTALLVSTASFNGLPVSTTHVSVGSIFGIGTVTRQVNFNVISGILLSWLLTLPVAAIASALIYLLIRNS
jgi:PiT family inorganic phosphate transporter